MSDDKDRECDMNSPSKVIQFSSNEVHRIFQEISGINEKLTTLVRIEEKVLNLTELHTNLRIRLENVEYRERKNELLILLIQNQFYKLAFIGSALLPQQ